MRAVTRVKTLPSCVNGHLTKKVNTNAITGAACSESNPKTVKGSSHQGELQHLKLSVDESVSYCFCSIRYVYQFIAFNDKYKDLSAFKARTVG